MEYVIIPLTPNLARIISTWHYPPPYDLYDLNPSKQLALLNPSYRYHAVLAKGKELVGFCCYGMDARVPGGDYQNGEPEVLDIGIGMRPDLTGKGLGEGFVSAVIDYADEQFSPDRFRATIAGFNLRSQAVFLGCGFEVTHRFQSGPGKMEFVQLEKTNW